MLISGITPSLQALTLILISSDHGKKLECFDEVFDMLTSGIFGFDGCGFLFIRISLLLSLYYKLSFS